MILNFLKILLNQFSSSFLPEPHPYSSPPPSLSSVFSSSLSFSAIITKNRKTHQEEEEIYSCRFLVHSFTHRTRRIVRIEFFAPWFLFLFLFSSLILSLTIRVSSAKVYCVCPQSSSNTGLLITKPRTAYHRRPKEKKKKKKKNKEANFWYTWRKQL